MEVKCSECGNPFEAARVTARFCSAKCKMRATRNATVESPSDGVSERLAAVGNELADKETMDFLDNGFTVSEVRVKRECKRSELCCTECVDFESGVHWCPSKGCGCWESKEEQLESLKAFERSCDHESTVMSRCLHCGTVLFTSKADKKGMEALRRFGCAKHNGSFSCGCEEKTVPKKSE